MSTIWTLGGVSTITFFTLTELKAVDRDGKDRQMIEIERSIDHFFVIDCDSSIIMKDRRAIEIESFIIENQASRCAIYESPKTVTRFSRLNYNPRGSPLWIKVEIEVKSSCLRLNWGWFRWFEVLKTRLWFTRSSWYQQPLEINGRSQERQNWRQKIQSGEPLAITPM